MITRDSARHGVEVFVLVPSNFQTRDGDQQRQSGIPTVVHFLSCFITFLIVFILIKLFSFKMSFWDSLSGRKQSKGPEFDPSTAQDATSFLSEVAIPDPTSLHPLAGLNQDTLDYITLEDSALDQTPGSQSLLPSRGWSDDLCYGAGTTYLAGLTIGGAWGLAEGMKKVPATAPPKIRLNGVLNAITRRGPFLGNSAGVVAMVYNGFNSGIGYARGKHDSANSIVAGALSGMVFKSTRGLKPMMISGGIVASIAGGWAVSGIRLFPRVGRFANSTIACAQDPSVDAARSVSLYSSTRTESTSIRQQLSEMIVQ